VKRTAEKCSLGSCWDQEEALLLQGPIQEYAASSASTHTSSSQAWPSVSPFALFLYLLHYLYYSLSPLENGTARVNDMVLTTDDADQRISIS